MILMLVNAGDPHVCPYCAEHSGPRSPSLEDFESEWFRDNPELSGWVRVGTPVSADLHPNCRCMLWRYEMSSCSETFTCSETSPHPESLENEWERISGTEWVSSS
ncbi:MAG: hypothetical protein Q4C47_01090 [Planctomycetia bacterium]|nr:hypothetical protein [Planctomycetia bacterium]